MVVEAADAAIFDNHDPVKGGFSQLPEAQRGFLQLQFPALELRDVRGNRNHLTPTGSPLGNLQPAILHERLFERCGWVVVARDALVEPSLRIAFCRRKPVGAQVAFQQRGECRTALRFIQRHPVVLTKPLVRQHQPVVAVIEREGIRHGLDRSGKIVLSLNRETSLAEYEKGDNAARGDDKQKDQGKQIVRVANLALHITDQALLNLHRLTRIAAELPRKSIHGLSNSLDLPPGQSVFSQKLHLRLQVDQFTIERIERRGSAVDFGDGPHVFRILEQRNAGKENFVSIDNRDRRTFRIQRTIEVHGVDVSQERRFNFTDSPKWRVIATRLDVFVVTV